MSFEHALYYPWIDINNSEWLKTAVLYWDKISTIVPEGVYAPYQNEETRILRSEEILEPFDVFPESPCVVKAADKFFTYLETEEANAIINPAQADRQPFGEDRLLSRIFVGKLTRGLREKLLEYPRIRDMGGYLEMDPFIANYYMDLLAAEISEENRWGLLTDNPSNEYLTNRIRRGDSRRLRDRYVQSQAQGMLIKLAFHNIKVNEKTPIDNLLIFRQKHADELRSFRRAINDLSTKIDPDVKSVEDLAGMVNEIYENDIAPAIQLLRKELKISNIELGVGCLLPVATIIANVLMDAENLVLTRELSSGMEIILLGVMYHVRKRIKIQSNPMSYILDAEKI